MIELSPFLTPAFAFAAAAAALGGILMGFTGFGSTLVMVPLLSILYGPAEAVAVGVSVSAAGLAQTVPRASRDAAWREVVPACLGAAALIPAGTALLLHADPELTRRLIGAAVLLTALAMLRGWSYAGPRNRWTAGLCGAAGGFTNGYFGIGAPAVTFYFLGPGVRAATARANILLTIGVFSVATVAALATGGGIGPGTWIRAAVLFVPYSLSLWIGSRLFGRASDGLYRDVALWLLVAMGATVLVS